MKNTIKQLFRALLIIIVYLESIYYLTDGIKTSSVFTGIVSITVAIIMGFFSWLIFRNIPIDSPLLKSVKQKFIYFSIGLIYLFLIFIITGVYRNITGMFYISWMKDLNFFLIALSAGIFEELFFRGLIFNIFYNANHNQHWKILFASIFSTLLFSLTHLLNLGHQSLTATIQQMIFAFMMGTFLVYLRIITNGLWVPVIVHTLVDFNPSIVHGDDSNDWFSLIIIALMIIIPLTIFIACLNAPKKRPITY